MPMTEESTNQNSVPTDVRRTTLIVHDMKGALRLYRDVLGLKVWYDEEDVVTGVVLPAGEPQSKIRLVILQGNDPLVGMVGLLEFLDPKLAGERLAVPRRLGLGEVVTVLNHPDVGHVAEKLSEMDSVHIHCKPTYTEYPAPNGGVYRRLSMGFFDPNGYFVELVELLN